MSEAYLIDTHVLLWYIKGDKRLSEPAKGLIDSVDNVIYLSKASLWEMTIKSSLGKLKSLGGAATNPKCLYKRSAGTFAFPPA